MKFQRLPGPVGQGYRLVEYISVARVRPRTSKGITDLLLLNLVRLKLPLIPLRRSCELDTNCWRSVD